VILTVYIFRQGNVDIIALTRASSHFADKAAEIAEKILDRQIRAGYLPKENADEVRELSAQTNNSIINILLEKNYISVIDLQNSLEDITGVACFDPAYVDWTKDRIVEICEMFPPKFLIENKIFFREKKRIDLVVMCEE